MNCPYCHAALDGYHSFCPYCGSQLGQAGTSVSAAPHSGHAGIAVGLILLLALGGLFASGELVPLATRAYDGTRTILTTVMCLYPPLCPNPGYTTTQGKASYDQQMLLIFSQGFSFMSYNVTAVPQKDSYGYGPSYLVNGLSDSGYWYQVGLAYNWPLASGTSYVSGFHFIWEVFYPNGSTNNPVLSRIPDRVNQGDTVQLSLSYAGTSVIMGTLDYNTGASSSHSYTAGGGSIFKGSSSSRATRTPTSLMTEWYHASPSEPSMKQVTYSEQDVPISSGWICIGEYAPSSPNSVVFGQCSSELLFGSQTQQYSYHGLIAYANQNMFQTGPS